MTDKPEIPGFRLAWTSETAATVYTPDGNVGFVFAENRVGEALWCAKSPKQRQSRTFSGSDLALACEWLRLRHGQPADAGVYRKRAAP